MLKHLHKRIRTLEARVTTGVITLTMPDGRVVRMLNGNPLQLSIKVLRSQVEDSPEARLLREAASVVESGGTHIAELARIMGPPAAEEAE